MKKIFLIIPVFALFTACSGGENKEEAAPAEDTTATEAMVEVLEENTNFGETITADGAMSPEEFLAAMEGKDSMEVKLATSINSCCKKKGCWMKLDMGEGNPEMRVRFKDYGFFVPLDSEGKSTVVQGVAFRDTTSIEDLRHYAEDAGKTEEEIMAITEPEVSLAFMASGAIVK